MIQPLTGSVLNENTIGRHGSSVTDFVSFSVRYDMTKHKDIWFGLDNSAT